MLDKYFDGDASQLARLLDPTRLGSPLHQFRTEVAEGFRGLQEKLAAIEAAQKARTEQRAKSAAKGTDFAVMTGTSGGRGLRPGCPFAFSVPGAVALLVAALLSVALSTPALAVSSRRGDAGPDFAAALALVPGGIANGPDFAATLAPSPARGRSWPKRRIGLCPWATRASWPGFACIAHTTGS